LLHAFNLQSSIFSLFFATAALSLGSGCRQDSDASRPACNWVLTNEECPDADAAGAGDPDDADEYEHCVAENIADEPRTLIQCTGSLSVSFSFDISVFKETWDCAKALGDQSHCRETREFGLEFEPYEASAVMACCDADESPEDLVLRYCAADMVEQVCLSVPERLQSLIDQKVIKAGKSQAKELIAWLRDHQQQCYNALHNQSADTPGTLDPASWLVNGGGNDKWPSLANFTIVIEEAAVTAYSLPGNEHAFITCYDNDYNNGDLFEDVAESMWPCSLARGCPSVRSSSAR
jgi:hypothetical protein